MKLRSIIEKNSPALLAAAGVGAFITAIVVTHKVAPMVHDILEEKADEPLLEKVKAVAPLYAPMVGLTLVGVGCVMASNRIHSYRYGALLALFTISERNYDRLQEAIFEEVGAKRGEAVMENSMVPTDEELPANLAELGEGELWFYDRFTGRYFRARSVETVRRAVNNINELMLGEDFASVNEFYSLIELPEIEFGDIWGWQMDHGLMDVRFYTFMYKDQPIIGISFRACPKEYNGH